MKRVLIVTVLFCSLLGCGRRKTTDAANGPGTMPADTQVLRVNQGAIGTDMGGTGKQLQTDTLAQPKN